MKTPHTHIHTLKKKKKKTNNPLGPPFQVYNKVFLSCISHHTCEDGYPAPASRTPVPDIPTFPGKTKWSESLSK